jgi:hypothetical protein
MGLMNGEREITSLKILKLNMCHEVEDGNLQSTMFNHQTINQLARMIIIIWLGRNCPQFKLPNVDFF